MEELFSLINEVAEIDCDCANLRRAGGFASVEECEAEWGFYVDDAQLRCLEATYDRHEDVATPYFTCAISEHERLRDCLRGAACYATDCMYSFDPEVACPPLPSDVVTELDACLYE
jgi:hypothetical protein